VTMRDQLLLKLKGIFQEVMDDNSLQINETTEQTNLRGWDSMAQIVLLSAIESEFDLTFTAREAGGLTSVSAILDRLESKLGGTRAALPGLSR